MEPPFIANTKKLFEAGHTAANWRMVATAMFPFLTRLIEECTGCDAMQMPAHKYFEEFLFSLYEERRRDARSYASERHNDLFQLLMESVDEDAGRGVDSTLTLANNIASNEANNGESKKRRKYVTKIELLGQCFGLLLAG